MIKSSEEKRAPELKKKPQTPKPKPQFYQQTLLSVRFLLILDLEKHTWEGGRHSHCITSEKDTVSRLTANQVRPGEPLYG